MTLLDLVLVVALAVFVLAWWRRRLPRRGGVLWISALVALVAGIAGVVDDRWQAGVGAAVAAVFVLGLALGRGWGRRRAPRTGTSWISGPLVTLLAIVGFLALYLFPVFDLPVPSGPNPVGVRTFELSDPSRPGVLLAGPDEPRRLLVRVWYPAGEVAGLARRPYFTQAEADGMANGIGAMMGFPAFAKYMKHARTHSYEDAPLQPGAEDLPTVFYSHGFHSFLSQNTALMEELASHGYVVYSVQHTYDAAGTVFADGSVAPLDPALIAQAKQSPEARGEFSEAFVKGFTGASVAERLTGQLQNAQDKIAAHDRIITVSGPIWLADRLFVHDRLQQGRVPASVADVVAASGLARTGEMGMSFGGSTSGAVCMVDPRCAAGINLDGADFHFLGLDADMPRPFLMFHSDFSRMAGHFGADKGRVVDFGFNDFSYESFERAGTRHDIYRMQLKETEHIGFSDMSWFMRRPLRDGVLGSAPAKVMLGAQNDFVRGVFDRHLRGRDNGFPETEYAQYEGYVLRHDNSAVRRWWQTQPEVARAELVAGVQGLRTVESGAVPATSREPLAPADP